MYLKSSILSMTNWSEQQLRDYVNTGIFPHPQRRRRQEGLYSDISKEYIRIHQQMPCDHKEIALELFLQGYPVGTSILRDALVMHFQRHKQLQQRRYAHKDRILPTPVKERRAIHRFVTRNLPDDVEEKTDLIKAGFQWQYGVPSTGNMADYGLPPIDDQTLAQRVENASDEQLMQAKKAGESLLFQRRSDIIRSFSQFLQMPQEIIGCILDGHTCPYSHTCVQALRPFFLAYTLCPITADEREKVLIFGDELCNREFFKKHTSSQVEKTLP